MAKMNNMFNLVSHFWQSSQKNSNKESRRQKRKEKFLERSLNATYENDDLPKIPKKAPKIKLHQKIRKVLVVGKKYKNLKNSFSFEMSFTKTKKSKTTNYNIYETIRAKSPPLIDQSFGTDACDKSILCPTVLFADLSNEQKSTPMRKYQKPEYEEICEKPPLNPIAIDSMEDTIILNAISGFKNRRKMRAVRKKKAPKIDGTRLVKIFQQEIFPDNKLADKEKYEDKIPLRNSMNASKCSSNRVVDSEIMERLESLDESMKEEDFIAFLDQEATKLETNTTFIISSHYETTPEKNTEEILPETPPSKEKIRKSLDTLDNRGFLNLREQADLQCKIMNQACKALEASHCNLEEQGGIVEAEKILLMAYSKYQNILQEIRFGDYESPRIMKSLGAIEISNISVKLNEITAKDEGWYLCIFSDELQVFATEIVELKQDQKLEFTNKISFEGLESNFGIHCTVYALTKEKFDELNKKRNIIKRMTKTKKKMRYLDLYTKHLVENNLVYSSFQPCGHLKFSIRDIKKDSHKMVLFGKSVLSGQIKMDIKLDNVKIEAEKRGFVNIRINTEPWNRGWLVLNGTILKVWNYPSQEDVVEPEMVIDLTFNKNPIESANRTICARPKTLQIGSKDSSVYLNFDLLTEVFEWKIILNDVYEYIANWHLFKE